MESLGGRKTLYGPAASGNSLLFFSFGTFLEKKVCVQGRVTDGSQRHRPGVGGFDVAEKKEVGSLLRTAITERRKYRANGRNELKKPTRRAVKINKNDEVDLRQA